ncbi:GDP-mannose-dependent alpha-(1-6)-phosphatidylinositol monomannoside mannosyltransferase [Rhodobacteraceae bacterium THAF1]|uniref:glycosyltransferase n=1 Tax=Palleronia sp. THAF1 TaxID=2587842 RepID=UPI000F40D571|nr:glycosyltransferase [Palleronia sp. THAF1]QFU10355.1 GDP-mannose-dependent alpha-(1-6)-phosphatidylinositol monomannoside mannosyltransferase [Palleronia sp. THAF1]VDC31474.1 GDP-mannose-dependent alpha-(1-6)-phosphatidylinositol monomannoside mannosyltransferase [Rhodobacteraceae bacterium THAF1]
MQPSRPLSVCVVTDTFPKLSETFILSQIEELRQSGVQVTVVADHVAPATEETHHLNVVRRWSAASRAEPQVRRLPSRWADRGVTGLDRAFGRRLMGVDAVICHFGMNGVRVARTGHRMSGFPPIITVFHGFDVSMAAQDGTLDQYHPLFTHPGLLLTVNHPFRETLIGAGAPQDRTRVHHLGIRPETIPFRDKDWSAPIRFLSVGRLTEKKGIDVALRALGQLRVDQPDLHWRYDIIGDGDLRDTLEALTRDLNLSELVRFRGAQPHASVREAMAKADSFLLPSRTASTGDQEGIPIVLMEAMSAGLIVVSTRHSGIPELVRDGETGLLADENDVSDLERSLRRVFEDRVALTSMTNAARRTIETEFHADRQNAELVGWVEELARNR